MTKAEELINKHLDRLNANNIIGKYGNIYKGFLNAINEALTIHVVSKCDCDNHIACIVCGEEKGLDGDFWKRMKEQ